MIFDKFGQQKTETENMAVFRDDTQILYYKICIFIFFTSSGTGLTYRRNPNKYNSLHGQLGRGTSWGQEGTTFRQLPLTHVYTVVNGMSSKALPRLGHHPVRIKRVHPPLTGRAALRKLRRSGQRERCPHQ